jgi:serine phosphatase RsbU (regulator of sigma subunit)
VLCDGCYEIRTASDGMLDYDAFEDYLRTNAGAPDLLERLEHRALTESGQSTLDDDFSIVQIEFPP